MTDMKTRLDEALDILDSGQEIVPVPPVDKDQEDCDFINEKLKELVKHGVDAVEELRTLASDTQEPRAFEVLSKLIKDTGDTAKGILDAKKTKKEIDTMDSKKALDSPNVTNNTIIVGTLSDILDNLDKQTVIEAQVIENGS